MIAPGCTLQRRHDDRRGLRARARTRRVIDSSVGDGATVLHSYLVEAEVAESATSARSPTCGPATIVREGAKIGTFVEVKNSDIGAGAKVPHLSYIGDADVGEDANIGAGTITANYDGRRQAPHEDRKTREDRRPHAFVAPVDVGDGAYTGAGSVITEDVPDGALGIARPKQKNVEGYAKRVEEEPGNEQAARDR